MPSLPRKTVKPCASCGREFVKDPHLSWVQFESQKFCSRACIKVRLGFSGGQKKCVTCGNEFIPNRRGILAWQRSKTCSLRCAARSRIFESTEYRFWRRINKSGSRQSHMTTECWEWSGLARSRDGYGQIGIGGSGRTRLTHRVSWELHYGQIPAGLCVLHRCDNPPCVRPDHLFLGTKADNARDMAAKGRQWMQRPEYKARRAAAVAKRSGSRTKPAPCSGCGRLTKPMRRGHCNTCYQRVIRPRLAFARLESLRIQGRAEVAP